MRNKNSRFLYMISLGLLIGFLLNVFIPNIPSTVVQLLHYVESIIITFLVWEGNLRIDTHLNKHFSWLKVPVKRIFIQFFISLLYSTTVTYFSIKLFNIYICTSPNDKVFLIETISLSTGVGVSLFLLIIEISAQFYRNWKKSLIEVEHYKSLSTQAQLQNLKNQVNPHFLFNNLSVLSSLVYSDQDKAVDFINQLSKVYRYLLENRNSELTKLSEEMTFIHSYIYLLSIRFDKNINFTINVKKEDENKLIPPLALQILIENAIKHNEISTALPLQINIITENDMLIVSNTLQPRINKETSSNLGLDNIRQRYQYYSNREVEIIQENQQFIVKLPLLVKI